MNATTQDLVEAQILGLRDLAKKLEAKADELRAENADLKRENAQLWDAVRDLQNAAVTK